LKASERREQQLSRDVERLRAELQESGKQLLASEKREQKKSKRLGKVAEERRLWAAAEKQWAAAEKQLVARLSESEAKATSLAAQVAALQEAPEETDASEMRLGDLVARLSNEQLQELAGLVREQEKARDRARMRQEIQRQVMEEKAALLEDRKCPVCLDAPKDCALGCGHLLCPGCADRFRAERLPCPLCREPVLTVTRVFS
jgi:hypothetical protein